jgi:hypothetical protein
MAADPELKGADFVVCLPANRPLMPPDNVVAVCCQCGRAVQHRPSVPRSLRKLCIECGCDRMLEPGAEAKVPKQQMREIAAFLKRRRNGLMARSVMGMFLSWERLSKPLDLKTGRLSPPSCCVAHATPHSLYRASGLVQRQFIGHCRLRSRGASGYLRGHQARRRSACLTP